MTVKQITVTYMGTLNLGNFNSVKLGVTFEGLLDEGESPEETTRELFARARQAVREQAEPLVKNRQVQVNEVFKNLPIEVQQTLDK
jgi:hypothetical protein